MKVGYRSEKLIAPLELGRSTLGDACSTRGLPLVHCTGNSQLPSMDSLLLPFQRQLLAQLVPTQENDSAPESSLTILARGVGLRSLVTSFVSLYHLREQLSQAGTRLKFAPHQLRVYNSSANLVLILNATEDEERGLKEQVGSGFKIISHEVDIKGR